MSVLASPCLPALTSGLLPPTSSPSRKTRWVFLPLSPWLLLHRPGLPQLPAQTLPAGVLCPYSVPPSLRRWSSPLLSPVASSVCVRSPPHRASLLTLYLGNLHLPCGLFSSAFDNLGLFHLQRKKGRKKEQEERKNEREKEKEKGKKKQRKKGRKDRWEGGRERKKQAPSLLLIVQLCLLPPWPLLNYLYYCCLF